METLDHSESELESQIDQAYLRFVTAPTPLLRRVAFAKLQALCKKRSARRQVAMEVELGLRAQE